jgi:hypothetical protein
MPLLEMSQIGVEVVATNRTAKLTMRQKKFAEPRIRVKPFTPAHEV